jgi:hypothetical protein
LKALDKLDDWIGSGSDCEHAGGGDQRDSRRGDVEHLHATFAQALEKVVEVEVVDENVGELDHRREDPLGLYALIFPSPNQTRRNAPPPQLEMEDTRGCYAVSTAYGCALMPQMTR